MTLQPKDCSWRSERDLRAIESEFLVNMRNAHVVDDDMHHLRRRILVLDRKEKQSSSTLSRHFDSLLLTTGVPMIDTESGEPTAAAWLFLSASAAFPLYVMCLLAQWFHPASQVFSSVL